MHRKIFCFFALIFSIQLLYASSVCTTGQTRKEARQARNVAVKWARRGTAGLQLLLSRGTVNNRLRDLCVAKESCKQAKAREETERGAACAQELRKSTTSHVVDLKSSFKVPTRNWLLSALFITSIYALVRTGGAVAVEETPRMAQCAYVAPLFQPFFHSRCAPAEAVCMQEDVLLQEFDPLYHSTNAWQIQAHRFKEQCREGDEAYEKWWQAYWEKREKAEKKCNERIAKYAKQDAEWLKSEQGLSQTEKETREQAWQKRQPMLLKELRGGNFTSLPLLVEHAIHNPTTDEFSTTEIIRYEEDPVRQKNWHEDSLLNGRQFVRYGKGFLVSLSRVAYNGGDLSAILANDRGEIEEGNCVYVSHYVQKLTRLHKIFTETVPAIVIGVKKNTPELQAAVKKLAVMDFVRHTYNCAKGSLFLCNDSPYTDIFKTDVFRSKYSYPFLEYLGTLNSGDITLQDYKAVLKAVSESIYVCQFPLYSRDGVAQKGIIVIGDSDPNILSSARSFETLYPKDFAKHKKRQE